MEILRLSHAFPFGSSSSDMQMLRLILDYLPPITEAWTLVDIYYTNSSWMSVGFYLYCVLVITYPSIQVRALSPATV